MKKIKNNRAILLLLFGFLIISESCKMSSVYLNVLAPAQIMVPSRIKTVAVINRSLPAKDGKAMNIIEGVLTQEALFADRWGSEECVKGVIQQLLNSPRFQAVMINDPNIKGTGTNVFPAPLDWEIVKNLCQQNKADALVILETFDSNNFTDIKKINRETKVNDQVKIITEYNANLGVKIEAGWRIYDLSTKNIIDQNVFIDSKAWSGTGPTEIKAIAACPPKAEMVKQAGYFAGTQYAVRISPTWVNVYRAYYKKGNSDFEIATRMAKANQWMQAADMWKKHQNSGDTKLAGRANYNIAIAYEVEGRLDEAIEYAKTSYIKYNNKKAKTYINQLQYRKEDQERLDEQMK